VQRVVVDEDLDRPLRGKEVSRMLDHVLEASRSVRMTAGGAWPRALRGDFLDMHGGFQRKSDEPNLNRVPGRLPESNRTSAKVQSGGRTAGRKRLTIMIATCRLSRQPRLTGVVLRLQVIKVERALLPRCRNRPRGHLVHIPAALI
jgi:hypothetical protein